MLPADLKLAASLGCSVSLASEMITTGKALIAAGAVREVPHFPSRMFPSPWLFANHFFLHYLHQEALRLRSATVPLLSPETCCSLQGKVKDLIVYLCGIHNE